MTTSNEELVQKAVITADALASQGKLNPVQADKFLDYVIDETVMRDNVRIIKFKGESLIVDKIGLGQRAAVPAQEAVDPSVRRGVNTSKITLLPKEIMTPWEIGDTFREINVELEKIDDHIAQMMARQTANDVEESSINGDLLGPAILQSEYLDGGDNTKYVKDGLHALYDGWYRLGDSGHVKSMDGANIGSSTFFQMIRELPTKWRRNLGDLRWFLSSDLLNIYMEKLSTRGTALGDKVIEQGSDGQLIAGVKPVAVPLFDLYPKVVEHITLGTSATVSLRYAPIATSPAPVVTDQTLAQIPVTPYVEDTDYSINYTAGTITNLDVGIGADAPLKVTYHAYPQILLTHKNNLVVGLSRDVRIEKDRDIFRRVNQYAITMKVDVQCEETDAIAKAINVGPGV